MPEIKVFCEFCNKSQPVHPIRLIKDERNKKPWGDIVCKKCNFVIATISAHVEGEVVFRAKEAKNGT